MLKMATKHEIQWTKQSSLLYGHVTSRTTKFKQHLSYTNKGIKHVYIQNYYLPELI